MKARHHLIRRMLLAAAIITVATPFAHSQELPTLSFTCQISDYSRSLPESAPQQLREFRGLLIEEVRTTELYPFSTTIFFDSGSATIPNRYVLLTDPSQTIGFADTTIPGGTLQKYYQALNIIGYRLQQHPEATISIAGCNSHERKLGETREVSAKRVENVREYLMKIWGIDPARLTMLPPRDLPKHPSDLNDPQGNEENRRVEITSSDWDIARTINRVELRRFPQPDTMHFQMSNGVADSLVARREIVITRGGKPWHVMTNIGNADRVSPAYNFGRNGNEDIIPEDEAPYIAQLVVHTRDGGELRSNSVEIPVRIIQKRDHHHTMTWKIIDRYSLILFPFDDARLDRLNERVLHEYVYADIRQGGKIKVTGYTDIIGSEEHNDVLSGRRADVVAHDLRKNVRKGIVALLEGEGVGENAPLYSNNLPEGCFYNRTVQIVVETPDENEEW